MEYQVFCATEKHQTAKGILLEGVFAGVLQEQWFPKAAIKPMGKSKWLARPDFILKHSIQVLDEAFEPEIPASHVYWDISDRTAITDTRGNYEHQTTALHVMSRVTRGALFMEMGTGKTRIALHLAKYRYKDGSIQAALYLCPLSVCYHIQGQAVVHGTADVPMCLLGIESFSNGMAAHED